jgi:hypothetical protein
MHPPRVHRQSTLANGKAPAAEGLPMNRLAGATELRKMRR